MEHLSHEPQPRCDLGRPCSTLHSAPAGWLAQPETGGPDPEALRAAIELVLAYPDAVAEVVTRARPQPVRHDGWTGERMATFLQVLADTGVVTEACRAAGMSRDGAYAFRNRDPVFAAAWRAAETKARPHVADGLLERSITGTVEHYFKDGVLVGERRHYESWLGLAVLKRLDKLAEDDRAEGTLSARMAGDWQGTLDMLRSGGTAALPAMFAPKVDKVDTPPSPPGCDPADDVWQDEDGVWMTCFPPPDGFDGHEVGTWDGINWYERACTPEEVALLEGHQAAAEAAELAQLTERAEAKRDSWFAKLRGEVAAWQEARSATASGPLEQQ